jgi:hypothetical protein
MREYRLNNEGLEIQELLNQIENKTIYGNATKDTAGLMSAEDKDTLDTLVDNVGENIQQLNNLNQAVSENTTAIETNADNIATNTSDINALNTATGNLGTRLDAAEETLNNIFQLDANNFMGIYDAAASLPAMTGAGWALVGQDLTALLAYVYNIPQAQWQQYSTTTYDYSDYSGLASQVATIGLKIGDLTELETTDKSDLVSAINEVKNNMSTTAEDTTYEDNYGIGADNVQDAIDKIGFVGEYTEIDLTQFTEQRAFITSDSTPKWLTTNNNYPYEGIFIPVVPETKYKITANATGATAFAFLISNAVGSNNAAVTTFATGCTKVILNAGQYATDTAPSDAEYMWVYTTASTTSDRKPQKIEAVKKSAADKLAEIEADMGGIHTDVYTLQDAVVSADAIPTEGSSKMVKSGGVYDQLNFGDANEDIDLTQYTPVRAFPNPNRWIVEDDRYPYYGMFIPIHGRDKYIITAQDTRFAYYGFLTESSYIDGKTVSYASGETRVTVQAGTSAIAVAPRNAQYLYVATYTTVDIMPKGIKKINKKSVLEILSSTDNTPVSHSENLITSGGVFDAIYTLTNFDDIWDSNNTDSITATRVENDIVVNIISKTAGCRAGFNISDIKVGEKILVDFSSDTKAIFGIGETLSSGYTWLGTYNDSFFFKKTSSTQKYIFISAPSYDAGTTLILKGFNVSKAVDTSILDERVNNIMSYAFMPSSYIPIKERYEVYMNISTGGCQGSTVYGNYFVIGFAQSKKYIKIYDLQTKELAQQVDIPEFSNPRYHANTISFSGIKYDNADEFPLLYICSGYTDTSSVSTSEVYVVRIIGTEGSWTTELVQTITLDFGKVNNWTEWVCDPVLNRAWIIGSGIDKYICVAIPDISESEVTITADTPIIDHFNTKTFTLGLTTTSSGQGRFFYHNRIYRVSGVPTYAGQGDEALYVCVDNTLTHCTEAVVPLKNFGLSNGTSLAYEPEGCFIWNDEFYVAYLGFIAKLIQN